MARAARQLFLPLCAVALATALTQALWSYIQPSATPLYFIAVMASSLYGGVIAGLVATCLSALATAFFFMEPRHSFDIGPDDAFRLTMFAAVALMTNSIAAERRRVERRQQDLIDELREATARIQTLSDQLPICPHCKRVRTSDSKWQTLESYLDEAPDLRTSHALCPQCARRVYPEFHTH